MLDTHAHLQFDQFSGEVPAVISRMHKAGVTEAVVVGTDLITSQAGIDLCEAFPHLYPTIGLHPTDIPQTSFADIIDPFRALVERFPVVAIGEVGLDYHYLRDGPGDQEKQRQHEVLQQFITLANDNQLPVIFHCRDAASDLLTLLKSSRPQYGGVIHCFVEDYAFARAVLDMGLHISFTAMISYPKNQYLRDVVQKVPHDRVMVETDCPFLPPQSKRGLRNEPANVIETAKEVATLWGKDLAYVDQITSNTAHQLFKIPYT